MLQKKLISLFSIICIICFSTLFLMAVSYLLFVQGINHAHAPLYTFVLLLFALIALLFFYAVYRLIETWPQTGLRLLASGFFAYFLLIEIILIAVFHSILPPVIDGGHTYAEALYLLEHGHASGHAYFSIYPNNVPITLLRYWIYRSAAFFHVSDFLMVDRLFCAAVLDIGIYFSWKLVKNKFDLRMGCMFLLLTASSFPLFFYILYFYTDTVAIMFPPILLYLWQAYSQSKKIRYIFLLGLVLAVGTQIRMNLILFLPALAIYMFFVLKWKKALLYLALTVALLSLATVLTEHIENQMGYAKEPSLTMPMTHWVMLGLSPDGRYSKADYLLTRKQPDQQAKKQIVRQEITRRIDQNGITGLTRIWLTKAARTFSMGTHGYDWYTRLSAQPTRTYQYLFNKNNQLTVFITQIFYLVQLFLLILSSLRLFRTKRADLNLLIQICLFGNLLFYTVVWEAEPRYSLLFTPVMILGAVFGLKEMRVLSRKYKDVPGRFYAGNYSLHLTTVFLLFVIVFAGVSLSARPVTQHKTTHPYYLVDQPCSAGSGSVRVDAAHTVTQTFRTPAPFDHISVRIRDVMGSGRYLMSVRNEKDGRLVASEIVNSSQMRSGRPFVLTFNRKGTHALKRGLLTIEQIKGSRASGLSLAMNGRGYEQRDIYPDGQLRLNGKPQKQQDLTFSVYQLQKRPYLSGVSYWLLFLIPVFILLFYSYVSREPSFRNRERTTAYRMKRKWQDD
ncbi:glycosyltransferase family 39 protein [Sporolactobacillus sp. THM19-2]|uniref:glycosyltransferase family 39 protein n=1 Tax=Sporolactobacillus sp. THM19-2 TaxID=2511171 RepID=UPI0010228E24|nr:glycosyltransferase family 39 protein [Sporolactobacillus sp. THM19-2]RYL92899.1 hypothetical protein EWH91_06280 [Sporolactobacillus sp. THM19-2]